MENQFSIEWLYNECVNHRKALGLKFKSEEFPQLTIVDIVLDENQRKIIEKNISSGINTNIGILCCKGYCKALDEKQEYFSFKVEDIEEVEFI